jgi:enoyl-CoA hydratase
MVGEWRVCSGRVIGGVRGGGVRGGGAGGEMSEVYPTAGPTFERTSQRHHYGLFLWPPLRLWEFPKVTIAQVHGYCVGGGTVYGLSPI